MKPIYVFFILIPFISCVELNDPDFFGDISAEINDTSKLTHFLSGAQSTARLSIYDGSDTNLLNALNNLANRGVQVILVSGLGISTSQIASSITYRSLGVRMKSQFALVDEQDILFFSDANDDGEGRFYLQMRSELMEDALLDEFNQLIDGASGANKVSINAINTFEVGRSRVELYLVPQNIYQASITSKLGQTRFNMQVTMGELRNSSLVSNIGEAANSGLSFEMDLGSQSEPHYSSYSNLFDNVPVRQKAVPFNFHLIFTDTDSIYESAIFTTFEWIDTAELDNYDGIVVIVNGPESRQIKEVVRQYVNALPE